MDAKFLRVLVLAGFGLFGVPVAAFPITVANSSFEVPESNTLLLMGTLLLLAIGFVAFGLTARRERKDQD